MSKIIGYRRVSTTKQEKSGLGLEAQTKIISDYAAKTSSQLLKCYLDIDSGKINDRTELTKALAHAKATRAILVVGVLDRISRNSLFINQLLESGVDFVDASSPNDTPFITRIKAALAQEEREKISQRTKLALAAAKARGVLLGGRRHNARKDHLSAAGRIGGAKSAVVRRQRAIDTYGFLVPQIKQLRTDNHTFEQIANHLNQSDYRTTRGGKFTPMAVLRILKQTA